MKIRNFRHKILSFVIFFYVFNLLQNFIIFGNTKSDSVKISIDQKNLEKSQTLKVSIPYKNSTQKSISNPIIDENPANGDFEITFSSVNLSPNKKQQISKSTEKVPLSILLFFLDNRKLKIVVKTAQYQNLNSYYSFEDETYYFVISYAGQSQLISSLNQNPQQDTSPNNTLKETASPYETDPNNSSNNSKTEARQSQSRHANTSFLGILGRSIKSALLVAMIIIFLVSATALVIRIYSGNNILLPYLKEVKKSLTSNSSKTEQTKHSRAEINQKMQTIKKKEEKQQSNRNVADLDDKVAEIQKIMNKQNLTYDEAELYFNMNQGNFNA
ncbi:MAG: DUF2015 domain-containing protein [Candidatus Marinimicrobia bacterium]|nr:DUF2015 domain-containing protein [Candidatus Neomarinimicrobiota bacterium]